MSYGKPPVDCGTFEHINLNEVMYYLYLPIWIPGERVEDYSADNFRLPPNLEPCRQLIWEACFREGLADRQWKYIYLSARKGWATPDNPLNRPGWHCDGFGSPDMNYVWWSGKGTRFLTGPITGIVEDHIASLAQFERAARATSWIPHGVDERDWPKIETRPAKHLYQLDRYTIHATPALTEGQMRQYVKISFSNERYNLYGNSHNYLFDYDWPMVDRETVRNDTSKAQGDRG